MQQAFEFGLPNDEWGVALRAAVDAEPLRDTVMQTVRAHVFAVCAVSPSLGVSLCLPLSLPLYLMPIVLSLPPLPAVLSFSVSTPVSACACLRGTLRVLPVCLSVWHIYVRVYVCVDACLSSRHTPAIDFFIALSCAEPLRSRVRWQIEPLGVLGVEVSAVRQIHSLFSRSARSLCLTLCLSLSLCASVRLCLCVSVRLQVRLCLCVSVSV